jgi:hypothetical protein
MIIAFAFGFIGALLVLANCRYLRNGKIFTASMIIATLLAGFGIYLITSASKGTDTTKLFSLFAPLTALVLLFFTRIIYRNRTKKEIILHIHGFFPVRQTERYVTRQEKNITFILLVLSVIIPFFILILVK